MNKIKYVDRFTKEIAVENETRLFEFTRMENVNGVKFFITSKDKNQKAISFSLIRAKKDNWKLMPGSLRWLYDIETQLSEAIIDTQVY